MEKVRPWCGQPSDRGRLKNRNRMDTCHRLRRGRCMAVPWVVISIKVVVVSQLPIALRAERSDGFYAVSCHVFGGVVPGMFQCRQLVEWPVAGVLGRPEYAGLSQSSGSRAKPILYGQVADLRKPGARGLSIEKRIPVPIWLFGLTTECRVLYISHVRCRRKNARLVGRGPVSGKLGPRSLPYWVWP